MPSVCCVPGCSTPRGSRMHTFPSEKERRYGWMRAVGREDLLEKEWKLVKGSYRVCTRHFSNDHKYLPSNRQNLKWNAYPTLFLPDNLSSEEPVSPCSGLQEEPVPACLGLRKVNKVSINTLSINVLKNRLKKLDYPLRHSPKATIIDQRCRICLMNTDNAIPLKHSTNISGEGSRTIREILNKFSKVEIAIDDNKPQSVCIDCVEKARIAYEFSISCEKSESALQEELIKDSVVVICVLDDSEFVKINDQNPSTSPVYSNPIETTNIKREKSVNSRLEKVNTKINVTRSKECVRAQKDKSKLTVKIVNRTLCVQCCRNFSRHVKFKSYTSVLIGRKMYQCARCSARFASPRNFNLHMISHKTLRYKYPKLFLM